jgi:phage shock protein C
MLEPRLVRSEQDRVIAGVCGGIAAYLGIDSILVRLAFVVLTFAGGMGIVSYLLLMFIMPGAAQSDAARADGLQDNLKDLTSTLADSVERAAAHPRGPQIAAGIFIALGVYLLLQNLGWIGGLWSIAFWPLLLIGMGAWLIRRRR